MGWGVHMCVQGCLQPSLKGACDFRNTLPHPPTGRVWAGKLAELSLHPDTALADNGCLRYTPYICVSSTLPAVESANPLGSA